MKPIENQIFVSRRIQLLVERFLSYIIKIELDKTYVYDFEKNIIGRKSDVIDCGMDLYYHVQNQSGNAHFLYLYSLIIESAQVSANLKELVLSQNNITSIDQITYEMLCKPYFFESGDGKFKEDLSYKISRDLDVSKSQLNFVNSINNTGWVEAGFEEFVIKNNLSVKDGSDSRETKLQSLDLENNFLKKENSNLLGLLDRYNDALENYSINNEGIDFQPLLFGEKARKISSSLASSLKFYDENKKIYIEDYFEFFKELKQIRNDLIHNGGVLRKKSKLLETKPDGAFSHVEIDLFANHEILLKVFKNIFTNIFYWHQLVIYKEKKRISDSWLDGMLN